jgi:hypothetical protein
MDLGVDWIIYIRRVRMTEFRRGWNLNPDCTPIWFFRLKKLNFPVSELRRKTFHVKRAELGWSWERYREIERVVLRKIKRKSKNVPEKDREKEQVCSWERQRERARMVLRNREKKEWMV